MQIALHPRRVVVDAERQVGRVGDVEEEAFDIGLGRADIGRRGKDGAVGAVVLGEFLFLYFIVCVVVCTAL
jgi:hypothetical protein